MNKLKRIVWLILPMFTSCSLILNTEKTPIKIESNIDSVEVYIKDLDTTVYTPSQVNVLRGKKPLEITVKIDSISDNLSVKPVKSTAFSLGNISTPLFLGYLFDLGSNKRFNYPNYIKIDSNDVDLEEYKYLDSKLKWIIYTPIAHYMNFDTKNNETDPFLNIDNSGITDYRVGSLYNYIGIGLGFEYYLKPNLYLSSDADLALFSRTANLPITLFYINTNYSIQLNHQFNKVHVGYGIGDNFKVDLQYKLSKRLYLELDYLHAISINKNVSTDIRLSQLYLNLVFKFNKTDFRVE